MRVPKLRRGVARGVRIAALAGLASGLGAGCSSTPATCNPYFPVPRGASWVYHDARQGAGMTMERSVAVESVQDDGRITTAVLKQNVHAVGAAEQSAGAATTTVRCAGGTVQLAVEGGAAGGASGAKASATVRAQLPGFPPADKLVPGYAWQSEGRVETTEGGTTVVTAISRQSQVDGVFPVKVPAGEFSQALRVASVETLKLATPAGEREAKQEVREWYVRGLGLVRRDTRLAGAQESGSVEELVQFTGVRAD
jgi:hypothetical protein